LTLADFSTSKRFLMLSGYRGEPGCPANDANERSYRIDSVGRFYAGVCFGNCTRDAWAVEQLETFRSYRPGWYIPLGAYLCSEEHPVILLDEDELKVWTQLFCAAISGFAANPELIAPEESLVKDAESLADAAFDRFASRRDNAE